MSLQLLNEILNHSNFKEIQNDLKLGYLSSKSLSNLKDIQNKLTLFLYNYEHDKNPAYIKDNYNLGKVFTPQKSQGFCFADSI